MNGCNTRQLCYCRQDDEAKHTLLAIKNETCSGILVNNSGSNGNWTGGGGCLE